METESNGQRRRTLLPVTLGSLSTLQGEDGEDGLDGVNGEQVQTSAAAHLYTCITLLCCGVDYCDERYQVSHSLLCSYKPKKKRTTSADGYLGSVTTEISTWLVNKYFHQQNKMAASNTT